MQWLVPKYLEHSMSSLAQNQEQIRSYFQTTFGNMFPFGSTLEEMGKQNMAVFERAMRVFTPFSTESAPSTTTSSTSTPSSTSSKPAAAEKETARTSNASSSSRSSSASSALASVTEEDDSEDDAMAEDAFTPSSNIRAIPLAATAQAAAKAAPASGEDVQQKIAALQRQLADLARNKG